MDFNMCARFVQEYLTNHPLIILGSGASMKYGLPSMSSLATEICHHKEIKDKGFDNFCSLLDTGSDLESALDKSTLSEDTQNCIRQITWECINKRDLNFIKTQDLNLSFGIAKLFSKVIQPTPNRVSVVTTNYDRIAEYAADIVGATAVTGFEGSLIRKLELPSDAINNRRIRARERIIQIWKVHGSLDWFLPDNSKDGLSFPMSTKIPNGYSPLIVPPGKNKYSATHNEPYRSIIAQADKSIVSAGAYLCVGYGFNDEHIQPKLLAEIEKDKPIIILAKQASAACKQYIISSSSKKYLIFEEESDGKTKVSGNGFEEIFDGDLWDLDNFLEIW